MVFVSKDENLTKAHIRYLEGRLIEEAIAAGRYTLENAQSGGSKLPESDREDMEVFLARIRQLLPVLGSELLVPVGQPSARQQSGGILFCRLKGAEARGRRTPDSFVILKGSTSRILIPNHRHLLSLRCWGDFVFWQNGLLGHGRFLNWSVNVLSEEENVTGSFELTKD